MAASNASVPAVSLEVPGGLCGPTGRVFSKGVREGNWDTCFLGEEHVLKGPETNRPKKEGEAHVCFGK